MITLLMKVSFLVMVVATGQTLAKGAPTHPPTTQPPACPAGFDYADNPNVCLKVVAENLTWHIAGLRCRVLNKDAHLVVVNNAAEQHNIASFISKVTAGSHSAVKSCSTTGLGVGYKFWTAGQRTTPGINTPFIWREKTTCSCKTKETVMPFTNWKPGVNTGTIGRACVQMSASKLYWYNDNCEAKYCFICQVPKQ